MSETINSQDGPFELPLEVRDYELDLQGIVNNANYFHYFEHARHAFIRSRGVDFPGLHDEGMDPVVYHAEIDYREPLRSGDRFSIRVCARREGRLRLVFDEVAVKESGREAARGLFVVAIVRGGRPVPVPDETARAICEARKAGERP
jgi:acyl-CoA thioester hydrolase